MKVTKFLAFLLVLPVLGGCTKEKVEEPAFKAYGNEVTLEAFITSYGDAYSANEFVTKMTSITIDPVGGEIKHSKSSLEEVAYDGNNKGALKVEEKVTDSVKADIVNYRYEYESVETTNGESEYALSGLGKESNEEKSHFYRGIQKIDEVDKLVWKDYITGKDPDVSVADVDEIKHQIGNAQKDGATKLPRKSAYEAHATLTDEEKAEYKYYVDGSVYTVVKSFEREIYVASTAGFVYGKGTKAFKSIVQADLAATSYFFAKYESTDLDIKFISRGTYSPSGLRTKFDVEKGDTFVFSSSSSEVYEYSFNKDYVVAPVTVPVAA